MRGRNLQFVFGMQFKVTLESEYDVTLSNLKPISSIIINSILIVRPAACNSALGIVKLD